MRRTKPRVVTLPPESLLGHHEPWKVRAWRHVEQILFERSGDHDANSLATFYGLPPPVVARAVARSDSSTDLRQQLGAHWIERPDSGAVVHRSRDGVTCVQPPYHEDVVRSVLMEWWASTEAIRDFVTQDLFTLVQLLTAWAHAQGGSSVLIVGDTGTGKC